MKCECGQVLQQLCEGQMRPSRAMRLKWIRPSDRGSVKACGRTSGFEEILHVHPDCAQLLLEGEDAEDPNIWHAPNAKFPYGRMLVSKIQKLNADQRSKGLVYEDGEWISEREVQEEIEAQERRESELNLRGWG